MNIMRSNVKFLYPGTLQLEASFLILNGEVAEINQFHKCSRSKRNNS